MPRKTNTLRIRRLAKEGTWIVLGQIAVVLGSLAMVRVLTEFLTPSEYGHLTLSLTLVALYNKVVFGGVSAGIGRHYAIAAEKSDLHSYLGAALQLLIFATAASLGLSIVLVSGLTFSGNTQWLGVALAATALALMQGYNSTLNSIQNAARQRAIVALHGGLDAWLKILFAVGLVVSLGSSSTTVLLGFLASAALVILSQLFFLRKTLPSRARSGPYPVAERWTSKMWAYSWPFSTWGIFTWMKEVSDRWALAFYGTAQDVGLYAVVFQLGYTPIAIVLGLTMTFVSPILYQRAGDATSESRNENVRHFVWRLTYLALISTALAVILVAILHEYLFSILVAEEFRAISYLLPWVVLAGGLFASGQLLTIKITSELASNRLLKPKIVTALLGVVGNILGAWLAGPDGVVAALILFAAIHLGWIIVISLNAKDMRYVRLPRK